MGKKKPPTPRLSLLALLQSGYFPVELPPPFQTKTFAFVVCDATASLPEEFTALKKGKWCEYSAYSLARPGSLRRRLAIINPIPFYRLASAIVEYQDELLEKARSSPLALLKPTIGARGNLRRSPSLDAVPPQRAVVRVGKSAMLNADVNRFYPSIYTHSIEWALTSKAASKARLLVKPRIESTGSKIDDLVQACQSGQTRGIPIGPASSMLLAEIILSQVDARLSADGLNKGFRFVDDYELVFADRSGAERALTKLEDALAEFELELNPLKTTICDLPQELDNPAIQELRTFKIRKQDKAQRSDFLHLFTRAFARQREFPDKSVLRYAVGSLVGRKVSAANAELLQSLILQAVVHEPGVWPFAIRTLRHLHASHKNLDVGAIRQTIYAMIARYAPVKHSSEVAWSLWAALAFEIVLPESAVNAVASMIDDCCSILLFHAAKRKLTETEPPSASFLELFTPEGLRDQHWLLSYELPAHGWLSPDEDHIAKDEVFAFLGERCAVL